ncbi:MAG TPA: winged helix DNA-binding domain-containing protein [Nocardia sp.]|uniref:winged helix DNA-binding domain-containing protein n=1 Tax=Nocardia TaxID=1817 RepID=UPI00245647DE|nr:MULTISPECIES: winged helix DNA-binding domain-containing protein [Nocardia]HLS77755.1 winged helix DNA-binding domain-containing protein [Nocardia sp.]
MRSIGTEERRARLVERHRLHAAARTAPDADDVPAIVRSLVVLHATDPATVYLSVAARSATVKPADIERTLYDDRALVRLLAMRRTMFVAPVDLLGALRSSVTDALAVKQRRTYCKLIEQSGAVAGDVAAWWAEVERETHDALLDLGAATGAQLSRAVPRLRTAVDAAPGKSYSKPTNITTWMLVVLGAEGRIVRGRPNGTWASSQYSWEPIETWLPDGIPDVPADEARAEVVRRWLAAFGPAPVSDIKWWTGWTVAHVRSALSRLDVTEVDLDGTPGVVLADDLEPTPAVAPAAALLPALDPTPMAWQSRDWFLGPHAGALFDRNGNIGPSVWWDGRIVGGWAQRRSGEIAFRLLEDIGAEAEAQVAAEAERIGAWFGDMRTIPRFRTPLERELTA